MTYFPGFLLNNPAKTKEIPKMSLTTKFPFLERREVTAFDFEINSNKLSFKNYHHHCIYTSLKKNHAKDIL